MKLLILTQKIDIADDILGFMHGWVAEFAKNCEKVTVICLYQGKYDLPANVKVLSLGKGKLGIGKKLKYIFNFYRYIWQERRNYDCILVHMNPEYVILGGLFWKLAGKKIGLWYTHKKVNFTLRLAEKIANIIFTASPESFRIKSKKVKIMGHGIDIERFSPASNYSIPGHAEENFCFIAGGRISPIKDYETAIGAVKILADEGLSITLDIFGGAPMPEHEKYLTELKQLVKEKGLEKIVNFLGPVANKDLPQYFWQSDLFLHTSRTGSVDKLVLEAMACQVPVMTSDEAFFDILRDYKKLLIFGKGNSNDLAEKIKNFIKIDEAARQNIGLQLRKIVVENHNLELLIKKIINQLNGK